MRSVPETGDTSEADTPILGTSSRYVAALAGPETPAKLIPKPTACELHETSAELILDRHIFLTGREYVSARAGPETPAS